MVSPPFYLTVEPKGGLLCNSHPSTPGSGGRDCWGSDPSIMSICHMPIAATRDVYIPWDSNKHD
ncbi:unnamed protein product [Staurois parvus]|uniref:Uncharacterized protein n=1 Tax=Staurois parvus TaxID=386267 RepID=A0ABN9FKP7_9NEOB|nr:unnamed protein product [Staurois parvus]